MGAIDAAPVDAAWVVIDSPLPAGQLAEFCCDLERLFRINPHLEFKYWRTVDATRCDVSFRNLSNGREATLRFAVERHTDRDFVVRYEAGLKRKTRFQIEAGASGSRLVITDEYGDTAATGGDTSEVDKSLYAWGLALRDYLRREARWGQYRLWRWYMRRVWVPMKPAARRIVFILLLVTLGEIALTALVMAIYWAEQMR